MKSLFAEKVGKLSVRTEVENIITTMPQVVQRGYYYHALASDVQVELTKDGPKLVIHWRIVTGKKRGKPTQAGLRRVK